MNHNMKSVLESKKGQLSGLSGSILGLLLAAIFLILGMVILQSIKDTDIVDTGTSINETVYQAVNNTLAGLGTFGDFWEIIVLAIVAAVVIGILIASFGRRSGR